LRLLRDLKAARRVSGTMRDNNPFDDGFFCAWILLNRGLWTGEVYACEGLAPQHCPERLGNQFSLTRFERDRADVYFADLVAHTDVD